MYAKRLLGTSSHGSSSPMSYYLCVPDDGSRPCLLVTCWADGDRILSAYRTLKGVKLWVITEADRSSTVVLLPDE